tara:strand:- start:415 stop:543 length:129 start_codon:yes stop_codon:yes gene_type:complete
MKGSLRIVVLCELDVTMGVFSMIDLQLFSCRIIVAWLIKTKE